MADFHLPRFSCVPRCGYCCKISPITIFPHEVHILKKLAEKFDIRIRIRPGYRLADVVNRVKIVTSYILELDPEEGKCPFLDDDDMCIIHSIYKPITCRSFPRVPRVLQYIIDRERKAIYFTYEIGISKACPQIRKLYNDFELKLLIENDEIAKKVMPNEYQACEEFLYIRKLYLDFLTVLWRQGAIEILDTGDYPWPLVNAYDFIRQYFPEVTIQTFTMGRKIKI